MTPGTVPGAFDGSALVQETDPAPVLDEGPCVDRKTGKVDPDTHYKRSTVYSGTPLVVTKRDASGVPLAMTGTRKVAVTILETSNGCDPDPKQTATFKRTLTKRG